MAAPPGRLLTSASLRLFLWWTTERTGLASLQHLFGIERSEELRQLRHEPGPSGLMTRAQPGAVVAVEVLVEEHMIAPVRIILECRRAAVHRPVTVGIAQEDAFETARDLLC